MDFADTAVDAAIDIDIAWAGVVGIVLIAIAAVIIAFFDNVADEVRFLDSFMGLVEIDFDFFGINFDDMALIIENILKLSLLLPLSYFSDDYLIQ